MKYLMPSFLREFKCLEEGYCCHRWKISVTPKELDTILSNLKTIPNKNWPKDCGFEIIRNEDQSIKNVYTKSCGNKCSFLVDKKCFLHAKFGLDGKPEICQSYPFYAIKFPNLAYINISMACPCSLRMLRKKNDFTLANPFNSIGNKFSLKANLEKWKGVSLTSKTSVHWDSFYYIHKKLLQKHQNMDFINHLWHAFSETKDEFLTKEQVVAICEKCLKKENFCQKTHLSTILKAWQVWHQENPEDDEVSPVISHFISVLKISNIDKISADSITTYFLMYNEQFKSKEINNILNNYLFILLFGSDFYFTHTLVEALVFISLSIALVKFFVLAANNDNEVSEDSILDAIFVLEKFFFHSNYFHWLAELKVSPYSLLGNIQ